MKRSDEWLRGLDFNPPEDGEFMLVRGLKPKERRRTGRQEYALALERTSPASGNYILFSGRRRMRTRVAAASRASQRSSAVSAKRG
jgi:hypothetical protein